MMFFFKRKTAYELRISDWSSDVFSSDLQHQQRGQTDRSVEDELARARQPAPIVAEEAARPAPEEALRQRMAATQVVQLLARAGKQRQPADDARAQAVHDPQPDARSEERRVGKERVSTCKSRWSRAL